MWFAENISWRQFRRSLGAFSAIVRKDENTVWAEDQYGKTIAQGEAGVDDAEVIQKALDVGGRIFIAKGEYIIKATDDPDRTDRAVGLYIPDSGHIEIIGEEKESTILKLKYNGERIRVDFVSNKANSVPNPEIRGVKIANLTLDTSLIDWYNWSTGEGTYKYGAILVFGRSARYFTDLKLSDLILNGGDNHNGWGIAIDYVPDDPGLPHKNVTIQNIQGYNLGRGVLWVARTRYIKVSNIYGENITGNSLDPLEGDVMAMESSIFGEIEAIRGYNVAKCILILGGTLRLSVRGVKGEISENGYGIYLNCCSHVQISDVHCYGQSNASGYGIYISEIDRDKSSIQLSHIHFEGVYRSIYVDYNDYRLKELIITNVHLWRPVEIKNVDTLVLKGGVISTGVTDIILSNCTDVDLDVVYTKLSSTNTTFRRNSGTATFSGDGTTTDFEIGAHGLVTNDASKIVVKITPVSQDAINASPCVGYVDPADNTKIRVKFSSAPASGSENVKIVWHAEVIS